MTASQALGLGKRAFSEWSQNKAARLAAAMALFTMLSLAPMLVITIKVMAVALDEQAAQGQVEGHVTQFVGPEGGKAVQTMIVNAARPGEGRLATIISTVLLVISATAWFASLQDALNTIWGVQPRPGRSLLATLRVRLWSLLLVLGVAALLLASVVLSNVIHGFAKSLGGPLLTLSYLGDLLLSLALTAALFALVFKVLPDAEISWRDVLTGAIVTAVLFTLGKYLLTIYFANAAPASAFGAAGSLAALLIWVYYSGMIAFFGAAFTKVCVIDAGKPIVPAPHAVLLTAADRAVQGIPTREELDASAAGRPVFQRENSAAHSVAADRATAITTSTSPSRSTAFAATAAAATAGVAYWYLAGRKGTGSRPSRRSAASVQLAERIKAVESKLGRISRLKDSLERMDVRDRIDRVEAEIHRAGRHVRARETGRPLWMVQLADLIGGRWSNA